MADLIKISVLDVSTFNKILYDPFE